MNAWITIASSVGFVGYFVGMALIFLVAWEDHTHEPTGIQDGTFVCLGGEAAVDYDISTKRPFIVCGDIEIVTEEKGPPPLNSSTHLAQ